MPKPLTAWITLNIYGLILFHVYNGIGDWLIRVSVCMCHSIMCRIGISFSTIQLRIVNEPLSDSIRSTTYICHSSHKGRPNANSNFQWAGWIYLLLILKCQSKPKSFWGKKSMLMFMKFGIRLEMWDLALRSPILYILWSKQAILHRKNSNGDDFLLQCSQHHINHNVSN